MVPVECNNGKRPKQWIHNTNCLVDRGSTSMTIGAKMKFEASSTVSDELILKNELLVNMMGMGVVICFVTMSLKLSSFLAKIWVRL